MALAPLIDRSLRGTAIGIVIAFCCVTSPYADDADETWSRLKEEVEAARGGGDYGEGAELAEEALTEVVPAFRTVG